MFVWQKNRLSVQGIDKSVFVDAFGLRDSSVLVSHAHSDHCRLSESNSYFMSGQTAVLAGAEKKSNILVRSFNEKFFVNGLEVSMHFSGHIVGSAQFRFCNGLEMVVTSDFKLQESLLVKSAEILPCDVLLIESTFGLESFVFPLREHVYVDMAKWVKEKIALGCFVVLAGYALGKAQELTKFVNEYLGFAPLVHKSVFEKNQLAVKAGARLGGFILLEKNFGDSSVLILPSSMVDKSLVLALSLQLGKRVECAVATGWKNFKGLKTFPLSDHADFNQLLEYVRQSGPKKVFTYHGFGKEFACTIVKRLGIPAMPLNLAGQKTLNEFC